MGFATVAATAVILVAASYGGSVVTVAGLEADARTDAALEAKHDRLDRRAGTEVSISAVQYDPGPGQVTIDADSVGRSTLDARVVAVLLDGSFATVDSHEVEGRASDVWSPGTVLSLVASWPSPPNDIAVVTQDGVSAYWRA